MPSTRLLREAPRTQHVVHVCAWRARRGERKREKMEGEEGERRAERKKGSEKTRYLKLHGSVYYLLSAISASTEKVHPTVDRRMICAPDALESAARSINEDARTTACRSSDDRNLNFFRDRGRDRYSPPLLFSSARAEREKRGKQLSRDSFAERS